jgi:hypothetical protein
MLEKKVENKGLFPGILNSGFMLKGMMLLICFLFLRPGYGQRKKQQLTNLPDFDRQPYHFGFVLSLNTANLMIEYDERFIQFSDSVLAINTVSQPGFNLAMLASWDMSGNWHLRFIPTLSFEERILEYTLIADNGRIESIRKNVSSTNIDFPLLVKYRTNRINNVALYTLFGGQFSLDLASQRNVNNFNDTGSLVDDITVRIDNQIFSAVGGIGIDFFLPYFKFGVELKTNIGLNNLLIKEDTPFSNPLQSIRTQSIVLSFTFEG